MVRPRKRRGPRGAFADRIRAARAARGMTQEAAARSLGVAWSTLAKWEVGAHEPRGIVLRVVEKWVAKALKEED